MNSVNCYEDASRAVAYATLECANTYYLAFRDLPAILVEHVTGIRALDFGCDTGRSTRLLRKLGFNVTGVDISEDMLRIARSTDPSGDYCLVPGDNLNQFAVGSFDLVLSAFAFDNIPGGMKARIFCDPGKLLASGGTIVNVVSSPKIYTHEWASFTSRDSQRTQPRAAVMSCASWLPTTRIGGLSRTSSGLTNRTERSTGRQASKRFRWLSL